MDGELNRSTNPHTRVHNKDYCYCPAGPNALTNCDCTRIKLLIEEARAELQFALIRRKELLDEARQHLDDAAGSSSRTRTNEPEEIAPQP